MAAEDDASRNLMFGLLALQNGMITQSQLVAAFSAWTLDKAKSMADVLLDQGALTGPRRDLIEALVREHLSSHGGDAEKSLASIPVPPSARESLARLGDPELQGTLQHLAPSASESGPDDATAMYSYGTTSSQGQRFRVLRPLASGGLGAVFVAIDEELQREVALKQILDHHADDSVSRQRFLLEAEITGRLEHPGIVPVYGLGTYGDGRPYYAMRFIRGDSLKEAIESFHSDARLGRNTGARSLELRKLLRRFTDVCNAIQYAHDRGILHRDIKPGNVIVGKHGETLVIDWGLAKPVGRGEIKPSDAERTLIPSSSSGSAETLPGSALGTPAYMSPEQASGEIDRLGPRSDVYSLGATLYCLLTGKAPFEGDAGDVLHAVQRGTFPPPRAIDPSLSRALEAICLTAMALRPEDRYPSCRALAEDVERWSADEPVAVYREPLSVRLTRWGRRHRTAAISIGVVTIMAVIGLSIGTVLINRERAKAEANFRQARAAVDRYFTTVSESRLLDVPGLQPLRKELLDSAREYYEDFLKKRGDDRGVRAETASASFRVGWITRAIGRPDDALEPLKTATSLYQQLVRAHPEVAEYRRLEALAHGALGLLFDDLGRADEALQAHREALAIREALAKAEPSNVLAQNDLARTHRNIGGVHRSVGKVDEALGEWDRALAVSQPLLRAPISEGQGRAELSRRSDPWVNLRQDLGSLQLDRADLLREHGRLDAAEVALRQAREVFEELVRDRPDVMILRARLGDVYRCEGQLQVDLGRFKEAERSLRRGREVFDGLAAANPMVKRYRSEAAENRLRLGWTLGQLGRTAEARSELSKAVPIVETLLADEPDSSSYRSLLARGLTQGGNLLLKEGRAAEAVPLLRRGLEIQEKNARDQPGSVAIQSSLSNALRGVGRAEAAAGHPAEARAAFDRAGKIDRSLAGAYPGMRYNVACSLALMIPVSEPDGREPLALQAIEALQQALNSGYASVAQFQRDSDLDSLRPRDDFKALLSQVQAKIVGGK